MIDIDKDYQACVNSIESSLLEDLEGCIDIEPPSYDEFGDELRAYEKSLND